ncbi:MAG: hypothetical protein PHP04_07750 [Bacteroidales bacterium]|nr:hypothetical protein [Bacteroidales bacterium]HPS51285.1 hypothetical protein [Bacteroidales bacterium]
MEKKEQSGENFRDQAGGRCECDGDCCQPRKKSVWPKVIFTIVMVAALAIVAAKLSHGPDPVNPALRDQKSAGCKDSVASKSCCDTAKTSSCCPK